MPCTMEVTGPVPQTACRQFAQKNISFYWKRFLNNKYIHGIQNQILTCKQGKKATVAE